MRDYAKGALEALQWALLKIEELRDLEKVRREIEAARDELLNGVAIDFRDRIRLVM